MKSFNLHLAGLALVTISTLSGCGQNVTGPNTNNDLPVRLIPQATAAPGEKLFRGVEAAALSTLSLSEAVIITPFMTGSKTPETASLSEMVAVTPAVVKFQNAFNAEMAKLSVGQAVRVTSFMASAGLQHYPYPVLDNGASGDVVVAKSAGQTLFETSTSNALSTLSLSEAVLLTPYLSGSKTPETSSLSELVAVTPVMVKFQTAFNAELAKLSVGDVVAIQTYMVSSGKNKYPYPEIPSGATA